MLKGLNAIVTGSTSGIGLGIANVLASKGANLVITGFGDADAIEKERAGLAEKYGVEVVYSNADMSKPDDVRAMVELCVEKLGSVDILVNNAGIIRRADAIDFTEADWDAVMDVNLKTAFFLSQAAAKRMIPNARGKIINIASMLSFQGGIRIPSYTASKSGLAGLTRLLACEWAAKGINVNAIAPGYFVTNNTTALREDPKRSSDILGRIPAGRWGNPEELGGAAVFLASDASAYVHGTILPVDGGWLAR